MTLSRTDTALLEDVPGFVRLRVKEVVRETAEASSLVFDVPATLTGTFRYRPGQFLTLRHEVGGEVLFRNYSLASAPGVDADLKVTIKRVTDGRVSNSLLDTVVAGAELLVMPPKGIFCLRQGTVPVVLFAAGSGITPVISILKQLLTSTERKVTLVYANRDPEQIIFREELSRLHERYGARMRLVHRLDSIQSILSAAEVQGYADSATEYYLCGPAPFMATVREGLIQGGVCEVRVFLESFDPVAAEVQPAEAPSEGESARVVLRYKGEEHQIAVGQGETIHAAAARQGLNLPFSCRAAFCGLCIARVTAGSVHLQDNLGGITDAQIAEGLTLTCQALVDSAKASVVFD
ncbi:MAG: ferredoxin--NADP reductase [Pararhodobacter sp.]|nr:ferredoxin--NADP reductase [Pararhodobacter sp.]